MATKRICDRCGYFDVKFDIEEAPTIEAEPVRRGWWESYISRLGMNVYHRCSVCGENNPYEHTHRAYSNYCPNCGAKMIGEANDSADA